MTYPEMPPLPAEFHAQIEPEYRRLAALYGRACAVKLSVERVTPDEAYRLARSAASYGLDALNWRLCD